MLPGSEGVGSICLFPSMKVFTRSSVTAALRCVGGRGRVERSRGARFNTNGETRAIHRKKDSPLESVLRSDEEPRYTWLSSLRSIALQNGRSEEGRENVKVRTKVGPSFRSLTLCIFGKSLLYPPTYLSNSLHLLIVTTKKSMN